MAHTQEFLHQTEPGREQAHTRRTRVVRRCLIVFFILLGVWAVALGAVTIHAVTNVFDARDAISQAKIQVEQFSFEAAASSLSDAQDSLRSASRTLPLIRSAAWVPFVGGTIDAFAGVIDSSFALTQAFDPVLDLGRDLLRLSGISGSTPQDAESAVSQEVTFDDLPKETKRVVLQRLAASADDLDLVVARLHILEDELSLLSQSAEMEPLLSLLDPLIGDLREAQEPLELLSIAARLLPEFGGLEEPSSILLLFLNNNELRPGGGFVGSYGVLEMSDGDIAYLETADVYGLDRAAEASVTRTAPEPLSRYNATTNWFFRDSNWSPDFAVSSQQAIELFLEEAGFLPEGSAVLVTDQIDHLVGITPTYASDLLAITGSITVGGQTFTAENVADLLEYQVQYGYATSGIPEAQRKEILADLVNEMKTRLYSLPSQEWLEVFEASQRALQEKQMLLYSTDAEIQQILAQAGWDGEVTSPTADTLMVVDANLAGLKSDPVVERDVTYELFQNVSDQWLGRVSIHYKHNGSFDWKTTRYRTYTRVYLPMGTQLLGVEGSWLNDKTQNPMRAAGSVDVEVELGLTSFGTFTSVEPEEENTLTFQFVLAPEVGSAIESGAYDLTVIKQAGAQNNPLTLDLDFGKNVTQASPGEDPGEWGDDVYRLNTILDQDLEIEAEF